MRRDPQGACTRRGIVSRYVHTPQDTG
jgi:hypothetical protein